MNNFKFGDPRLHSHVTDRSALVPVYLHGRLVADAQVRRGDDGNIEPAGFLPHVSEPLDGLGDAVDRYLKENRELLERTIPM
jgi:hypothetical protein